MEAEPTIKEYKPLLIPRRGEVIAWLLTLLVGVVIMVYALTGQTAPVLLWIFALILVFSALLISLSNWVDRHTVIRIQPGGIEFHNGLHNVDLTWEQIDEIRIQSSEWGKRVQIYGERTHFVFRTLGEVHLRGKLQGRLGFESGEDILHQVVANSGLQIADHSGEDYYYARL
jgi:hypothetical protein